MVGMRSIVVGDSGREAPAGRHVRCSGKRYLAEVQRGSREVVCVRWERSGTGKGERGFVVLEVGQSAEDVALGYPSQ